MRKFINKFLGALTRFVVFSPFILLAIAFVPFIFIDRLIQGRPMAALCELLMSLLKILLVSTALLQILVDGWSIGLINLLGSCSKRVHHFFNSELSTDSNLFFSVVDAHWYVNHFEGLLFGAIIRKLIMIVASYEMFKTYEDHHESPHNADLASNIDTVYEKLKEKYNPDFQHVGSEITKFLNSRMEKLVSDSGPDQEEIIFAEAAERCFSNFKVNFESNSIPAIDLNYSPTPLIVLYLVWEAIEKESKTENIAYNLKIVLVSYLTQIQRGFNRCNNPEERGVVTSDQPECPTGAVAILLEVLKSIPNSQYKITPTKVDRVDRLRALLHARLDHNYNTHKYMARRFNCDVDIKFFKKLERRPVQYYAQFLLQTPQGASLLEKNSPDKLLTKEEVDATVEATIESWGPTSLISGLH